MFIKNIDITEIDSDLRLVFLNYSQTLSALGLAVMSSTGGMEELGKVWLGLFLF